MGYTNSPMVVYTKLSPNHSGQRTMAIDRITPHCVVGQCTAEGLGDWFYKSSTQASSNYGIDKDGRVGMYVEEKNRSWCSSSGANDQRAITIECASDTTEPYAFRDIVYQRLIELCVDICKRNGKNKLIWFGDKDKTLNYSPQSGEMILTVHRWFANKSCPGNWMYARMGDLAEKVTKALQGSDSGSGGGSTSKGTQAAVMKDLSEADAIKRAGALFTADMKKNGILRLLLAAALLVLVCVWSCGPAEGIDPLTYEPNYKVIGQDEWYPLPDDWNPTAPKVGAQGICGSGVIDAIAAMHKAGVISKAGRINAKLDTPRVRRGESGKLEYVLAWAKETAVGKDIVITQADIRAVQLAKAALYVGAEYLMEKLGVDHVDEVILAGAFGSYIDKESAMAIGMFPDCDLSRVRAVGNAAGDGARIALLDAGKRREAASVARQVEFVETAIEPDFQKKFMDAIAIPHAKHEFSHLKS